MLLQSRPRDRAALWDVQIEAEHVEPAITEMIKDQLAGLDSRRRDCHFDDTPCLSLLKHLIKVQGGAIK